MTDPNPQGGRVVFLIDVNAMFAACAAAEDPALRGKPVIVAGDPEDRRSIVLTSSYEARARGVKTATPLRQALSLCPEALVVPPDHALYRRYHEKMIRVLQGFTPVVESVSIDEAFMDVTGCPGMDLGVAGLAREVRRSVLEKTQLKTSLGVSTSRFLAKMASSLAKRADDGVFVLWPSAVPKVLWPLPVGAFHGIGPKTEERLMARGIRTIGDLERAGPATIGEILGSTGPAFLQELRGEDQTPVKASDDAIKSMSHELTFSRDIPTPDALRPVLLALSDQVAHRLRSAGLAGSTVGLRLRNNKFKDWSRQMRPEHPVFLTGDLYRAALGLMERMPKEAFPCRLAGVGASGLLEEGTLPQTLFEGPKSPRADLARAVDRVRAKFGEDSLRPAGVLGSPGEDLYDHALFGSSFKTRGQDDGRKDGPKKKPT